MYMHTKREEKKEGVNHGVFGSGQSATTMNLETDVALGKCGFVVVKVHHAVRIQPEVAPLIVNVKHFAALP